MNTSGGANTASGWAALSSNTIGLENTATGDIALTSNITGLSNTATAYTLVGKKNKTINGMDGVQLTVEFTSAGRDLCCVYWTTWNPGGAYEVRPVALYNPDRRANVDR